MSPKYGELLRLSIADRIQLVEDLWDSITEDEPQHPLAGLGLSNSLKRRGHDLTESFGFYQSREIGLGVEFVNGWNRTLKQ